MPPVWTELPTNGHGCGRCALSLLTELPSGALCGECQKRLLPFTLCHVAFRYEVPLPDLVAGAKFRDRLDLYPVARAMLGAGRRDAGADPANTPPPAATAGAWLQPGPGDCPHPGSRAGDPGRSTPLCPQLGHAAAGRAGAAAQCAWGISSSAFTGCAWRKAGPVEDLGPGAGEGLATGDPCRWCQPEPGVKVPSGRKARQVGSDLTGKHQHGVDPEGCNAYQPSPNRASHCVHSRSFTEKKKISSKPNGEHNSSYGRLRGCLKIY